MLPASRGRIGGNLACGSGGDCPAPQQQKRLGCRLESGWGVTVTHHLIARVDTQGKANVALYRSATQRAEIVSFGLFRTNVCFSSAPEQLLQRKALRASWHLLRGYCYLWKEGWHPGGTPRSARHKQIPNDQQDERLMAGAEGSPKQTPMPGAIVSPASSGITPAGSVATTADSRLFVGARSAPALLDLPGRSMQP